MSIRKVVDLRDLVHLLYIFLPMRWLLAMARLLGNIDARKQKSFRKKVTANLKTSFSDELSEQEIEENVTRFFEFQRIREMQKILLPRLSPGKVDKLVKIEGLEHLDAAMKHNKGVILLASHLNSTFNFTAVKKLKQMGYNISVVMPTQEDPFAPSLFGRLLKRIMHIPGLLELMSAFYAQFNVRPIISFLSNNGIAMLLGDGFHSAGFVRTRLLGQDIAITTGPANVARIAGAPIVPFFMVGNPPYDITAVCKEPIWVNKTENSTRDLEEATAKYAAHLDTYIRENIPTWQHWEFEQILQLMDSSLERSLAERLHM